jgi:hypothetical protein
MKIKFAGHFCDNVRQNQRNEQNGIAAGRLFLMQFVKAHLRFGKTGV